MATALDNRIRPLAASLIQRYGTSVIYRSIASGTYNTATATTTPAVSSYQIKAILGNARRSYAEGLVRRTGIPVTIAARDLPVEPKTGDVLRVGAGADAIDLRVTGATFVYSGDLPAVYELEVAR